MNPAALPASQLPAGHTTSDPPAPAAPAARRLVLVPAGGRDDELVRRYRLARLRLESRRTSGEERFAHLKQRHD